MCEGLSRSVSTAFSFWHKFWKSISLLFVGLFETKTWIFGVGFFFCTGFGVSWAETGFEFWKKRKKYSRKYNRRRTPGRFSLKRWELGRRVSGGSSESAARPFDQAWPGLISYQGECNKAYIYVYSEAPSSLEELNTCRRLEKKNPAKPEWRDFTRYVART